LFRWRGSYGNNQQYESKQITPSTTTTGNGSKRKEPDKGKQNPEQEIQRKEPEMRKRKTKQMRTSVSDVARRVTRKGTLSAQKITNQRK
jgi:hypothetical protein